MRALFCGDRHWIDKEAIKQVMIYLSASFPDLTIIEGEANGADKLAKECAKELSIPFLPFSAEWDRYRYAAGPVRNTKMLKEGKPDMVVAFHYDLRHSKGTKNMITQAMKAGLAVWVCTEGFDKLESAIQGLKLRGVV